MAYIETKTESELVQEYFELYPFNLETYVEVFGQAIRSNKDIVRKTKDLMRNSRITEPIADKISEGLDKRTIIVGYSIKPLSFFWRRLKHYVNYIDFILRGGKVTADDIITLGFYDPQSMKVILLLDDNVNLLGRQITQLPVKLTHELCHYSADINYNQFISKTMRTSLLPFYRELLLKVASKSGSISDSKIISTIKDLAKINEGLAVLKPDMPKTFKIWSDLMTEVYNEKESIQIARYLSLPYYAFIIDQLRSKYLSDARKSVVKYYKAYESAFGLDVRNTTIPGQEFRFPSEVIAISNEFRLTSSVKSLINSTPMKETR